MTRLELGNCQISFLPCKTEAVAFQRAVTSRFAALGELGVPFLSTVHAVLQAGNGPIRIKAKVVPRPGACSSAQIPSSSWPDPLKDTERVFVAGRLSNEEAAEPRFKTTTR